MLAIGQNLCSKMDIKIIVNEFKASPFQLLSNLTPVRFMYMVTLCQTFLFDMVNLLHKKFNQKN